MAAISTAFTAPAPEDHLDSRWRYWRARIDEQLLELVQEGEPEVLWRSMRYSVEAGGKRLRPLLTLATLEALGRDALPALPAACALELVHTFSLIHDDLPALDNDDFRRGRPSNHAVFGEATAILAGDALLALAFRVLSRELEGTYSAQQCLACVRSLSDAAVVGLASGQADDLRAGGQQVSSALLRSIHERKTGSLFRCAVEVGAILGSASARHTAELDRFASSLGVAFQIADDVLDVTKTKGELGKSPGKDDRDGKATYVRVFGLAGARQQLRDAGRDALAALASWGPEAALLRGVVAQVLRQVEK